MAGDWFYVSDETELGPLSREQLQNLLASGEIGADTPVRKRSWMEWYPAKECLSGGRETKILKTGVEAEYQEPVQVRATRKLILAAWFNRRNSLNATSAQPEHYNRRESGSGQLDASNTKRAEISYRGSGSTTAKCLGWIATCDEAQRKPD